MLSLTQRVSRYVAVGGAAFCVDEGVLVALNSGLHASVPLATTVAFFCGFGVNFSGQRKITFAGSSGSLSTHLFRYLAVVAANLVVTVVAVTALATVGVRPWLGKPIVVIGCTVANLFLYQYWVYA